SEVDHVGGWALVLLYEQPRPFRRLNELLATTQTLVERVEKGQGAAGVLVSPESTASAKRFVAAMDRISGMVEQPEREPGLLPGLLFDPKYRPVLEDLRTVAHNLREVSDRLAGGRSAGPRVPSPEPVPAAGGPAAAGSSPSRNGRARRARRSGPPWHPHAPAR